MKQHLATSFLFLCLPLSFAGQGSQSQGPVLLADSGIAGPPIEVVHYYYDLWPTGIAVSSTGRLFSNYPPALDHTNVAYTVAELTSNKTETPYPSLEFNSPPGGRINYTTTPPTSSNAQSHLIGVQSVVVDPADRLWILDTGRAALNDSTMAPAAYGGPKLVGVNLTTNSIFQTIIFTPAAAPADSYLNDIRFDLTPSLTPSGKGVAYITDSSPEGRNAIVIVDLGTGEAWRHLINIPATSATSGFVPTLWGETWYTNHTLLTGDPIGNINFGADGIAISADGSQLYFSTTGGRELYSVPTSFLRDKGAFSELKAVGAVTFLTQKGLTDGMESDSNNVVYLGIMEGNAIATYNTTSGVVKTYVRDPRLSWTDTFAVADDGYVYFTVNQLWRKPDYWNGIERRVKPWFLGRVKTFNGGRKVRQPAP